MQAALWKLNRRLDTPLRSTGDEDWHKAAEALRHKVAPHIESAKVSIYREILELEDQLYEAEYREGKTKDDPSEWREQRFGS